MQSVVKQQIARSRSAPPRRNPVKEAEANRRIDLENARLMKSLINIGTRANQASKRSNVELVVVGTRMGYVWVIDHLCFVDNEDVDNGNDTTEEEE
ncbi:unnamed protein product [Heligmosomoides polygyrus]|uniref:BHLH domain-containing protein n=1 Tax=Heligmosomoides polygyrus TaxID=6339 RepID=A0A3P8E090_HELPZ|nr:unnamed protein product [Heligmosomoides polygyrus]